MKDSLVDVRATVRLELTERTSFAQESDFAGVGCYERIRGRVHYAVDPADVAGLAIEDMELAPLARDGCVHFVGDILILRPGDLARGNRRILFDFPNRGNVRSLQFFNDAPATNDPVTRAHAGNGFLMRRGYTVVVAGWQGDVLPGDLRLALEAPLVGEGKAISKAIRTEYVIDRQGVHTVPLSGRIATRSYPAASLDNRRATLCRRRYPGAPRFMVPHDRWAFARLEGGSGGEAVEGDGKNTESALVPSATHLHLRNGFETGWIYELEYEACEPRVLGVGFLAVRELVSFLRSDKSDENPLYDANTRIEKAYGWGRSQSGRCVRDFVYRGFNGDSQGHRVFDGVMTHVAGAGRMTMERYSNLVIASSRQYEDHDNLADRFPFSYAESVDHVSGERDAILKRPETDPFVLHTQTATEYWQRRGSLVHTDTRGNDLTQPANVRVYLWSSSQHWADPNAGVPTRGICENLPNIVATSMLVRAHLDALDDWVSKGREPPESSFPRHRDGTLVTFEEWRRQFPIIPAVKTPCGPNALGDYAVLVPAVDSDGNDIAGIRVPMVAIPLGTYTGWNLRARGYGEGALHDFTGSYVPFPETKDVAAWTNDPRRPVADRYESSRAYVDAMTKAAEELVGRRLMLAEDIERVAAAAAACGRPRHDVRLDDDPRSQAQ